MWFTHIPDGNYSWLGWVYKYALTDHLGNTRVVFSDKNDDGIVGVTDIEQINNFYPFGLNIDGPWNGASGQYKYQYNNKEWNSDLGLNLNDYGARLYDPTIGRWGGVDKLAEKYLNISPFAYVANDPIALLDPNGLYIWISWIEKNKEGNEVTHSVRYQAGKLYETNGKLYTGQNAYAQKVAKDIDKLSQDNPILAGRIITLEEDKKHNHVITMPMPEFDRPKGEDAADSDNPTARTAGRPTGSIIEYDPDSYVSSRGDKRTPRAALSHELVSHAWDYNQGKNDESFTKNGIPMNEVNAVNIENLARQGTGDLPRTTYNGKTIPNNLLWSIPKNKKN